MKMGDNRFEKDYIAYLERNNANLRDQSLRVKEFENRLLNNELPVRQGNDIKNICNSTCEAIDYFFENFTATMNLFKSVLLWISSSHVPVSSQSEFLQIPQKPSCALNAINREVNNTSGSSNSGAELSYLNGYSQNKNGKRSGTAKVSPMIRGHVISAPRIHLNRLTEDYGLQSRRPLGNPLSPIIEQSPSTSPQETQSPVFRNIRIPLRRLKIGNLTGKVAETEESYEADASPEINFTGRNCAGFELRRRYNSLGDNERFRMMRDRRVEVVNRSKHEDEVMEDGDCMNEENPSYRSEALENNDAHGKTRRSAPDDHDPLEGPSWLLNKKEMSEEAEQPGSSDLPYRYVNLKRPNSARSCKMLSDENKRNSLNVKNDQVGNFNVNSNQGEMTGDRFCAAVEGMTGKCSCDDNKESSSEHSLWSSDAEEPEEYSKFDSSQGSSKVNSLSFTYSPVNRSSLQRKSIHDVDDSPALSEPRSILRRSSRSDRLSRRCNSSNGGNNSLTNDLSMDCYVNLRKLPIESGTVSGRGRQQKWDAEAKEPAQVVRKSDSESTKRNKNVRKTPKVEVSEETPPNSAPRKRTKRRVAERCIEDKVWLDVTPKWEAKIKRERRGIRKGTKKVTKKKAK